MQGVNTYQERIKNPGVGIINWEFISNHPEAKLAIWERYQTDASFKIQLDQLKENDPYFKRMFDKHFASYKETRGR